MFAYLPILAASALVFYKIPWGYQLLVLAIEATVLALFIIILTILEFKNSSTLFNSGDEQYVKIKQRSFMNLNVSSGAPDLDESTLIRKKHGNDDREILLRKKALVTIIDFVGNNFMQAKVKVR